MHYAHTDLLLLLFVRCLFKSGDEIEFGVTGNLTRFAFLKEGYFFNRAFF